MHHGMKDQNDKLGWTMSREIYPVHENQEIKVGRDSVWCGVGLGSIMNFASIKGCVLDDWVGNWLNFSEEKKREVFDKKICHELNCYIYCHDKKFFTEVVKPHLQNKLKKTFVDLYLLESKECLKWMKIEKFRKLNAFEQVLLIKRLVEEKHEEEALMLSRMMKNLIAKNKVSFEAFKAEFETIIYAKLIEKKFKEKK